MKETTLLADNTMASWIMKEGCTSLLNVDRRTAVMLLFLAKCGRGSDLVLAVVDALKQSTTRHMMLLPVCLSAQ